MWGLLIALLVGVAYGWMSPGKQDKSQLFLRGLLYGVILAVVIGLLGFFFGLNPLGLGDAGFFGIVIAAIVLTIAFLIGVWIGDMMEHRRGTRARM